LSSSGPVIAAKPRFAAGTGRVSYPSGKRRA
jgi:hypothetical protein